MRQAESAGTSTASTAASALQKSTAAAGSATARRPLPRSTSNGKLPTLGHSTDALDLEGGEGSLLPPLPPLPPIARRSNPNSSVSSDRRGRFHQFVLAVSANSDNDTVQAALDAGADGFISKPFTYDSFTEAMQQRGCSR
jgi:hypothetical protein